MRKFLQQIVVLAAILLLPALLILSGCGDNGTVRPNDFASFFDDDGENDAVEIPGDTELDDDGDKGDDRDDDDGDGESGESANDGDEDADDSQCETLVLYNFLFACGQASTGWTANDFDHLQDVIENIAGVLDEKGEAYYCNSNTGDILLLEDSEVAYHFDSVDCIIKSLNPDVVLEGENNAEVPLPSYPIPGFLNSLPNIDINNSSQPPNKPHILIEDTEDLSDDELEALHAKEILECLSNIVEVTSLICPDFVSTLEVLPASAGSYESCHFDDLSLNSTIQTIDEEVYIIGINAEDSSCILHVY